MGGDATLNAVELFEVIDRVIAASGANREAKAG